MTPSEQSGAQISLVSSLNQQSSTFLAPGTGFVEDNFTMDWLAGGGWFQDDLSTSHLLSTSFLL